MVNAATIVGWPVSSKEQRERQKQQQQQQQQEMHQYQEMGSYNALNEVEQQMKDSLDRQAQYRLQKSHPLVSAGARYKAECFCSAPFSIHDVPTGRIIDMDRTFHPRPFWLALVLKTVIVLWAWSLLISGLFDTQPIWFYFAYLTIWSLTISCIYLTLSWVVSMLPFLTTSSPTTTNDKNDNNNHVPFWIYATWLIYTIAAPAEILVAVLYWTVEWDWTADDEQEITYRNLMIHGGLGLVLLFEGLVVNRTPIRINQQWFFILYTMAFMGWTLYYELGGVGNPTTPLEDDTLYTQLNWTDDPVTTAALAAFSIMVVAPLSFSVVWLLSLYSCPLSFRGNNRRYIGFNSSATSSIMSAKCRNDGSGLNGNKAEVSWIAV
jgi:hypothetical protein